jgi:hypothetical protein
LLDQLNQQVDFLNEQLALREAQLVEMGNKLLGRDSLEAELNQKYDFLTTITLPNIISLMQGCSVGTSETGKFFSAIANTYEGKNGNSNLLAT